LKVDALFTQIDGTQGTEPRFMVNGEMRWPGISQELELKRFSD
jgi:hypothetical protein